MSALTASPPEASALAAPPAGDRGAPAAALRIAAHGARGPTRRGRPARRRSARSGLPAPALAPRGAARRGAPRAPDAGLRGGARCRGARSAPGRGRASGPAPGAGLCAAVAAALLRTCRGALSISSGYENFLSHIRHRVVCDEAHILDEAAGHRGLAAPCSSVRDGPFCRGLPNSDATGLRHRPSTVDSIVPQQLFGDARATLESLDEGAAGQTATSKQGTDTMNKFLQDHYQPKDLDALPRALGVEGLLGLSRLPWWGTQVPTGFSRGLPDGVTAVWDGAWQPDAAAGPDAPDAGAAAGESATAPRTAARLGGDLGVVRFSRAVVVRRLLVRPPPHARAGGRHLLLVRARKGGQETWRSAYEFDGTALVADSGELSPEPAPLCDVGDLVVARWAGDGRRDPARVLSRRGSAATLRWTDNDPTHREVLLDEMTTTEQVPCSRVAGPAGGPGRAGAATRPRPPWRDLARRVRAVDEVSFTTLEGARGWLLGEMELAATLGGGAAGDEGEGNQDVDETSVVQVFPGGYAIIAEASRAAVLYNADDMLEQGLRLRRTADAPAAGPKRPGASGPVLAVGHGEAAPPGTLRLGGGRSSEGLLEFFRQMALGHAALPAHVRRHDVLADSERLLIALAKFDTSAELIKRYKHFEAYFAYNWDVLVAIDALEVAYERWRQAPVRARVARQLIWQGQSWLGSYFCAQGLTSLALNVTKVEAARVEAELIFTISTDSEEEPVTQGQYAVAGTLPSVGQDLTLTPVPGSWRTKPSNFVMVGLQGVLSRFSPASSSGAAQRAGARVGARFAGSVPIVGCDAFELTAEASDAAASEVADADAPPAAWDADEELLWRAPLRRLGQALQGQRQRWQVHLQRRLKEKVSQGTTPASSNAVSSSLAEQVAQLVMEAQQGGSQGQVSFQMTMADGEEVIVSLGGT